MSFVVGLTGGIGSGKSAAAAHFAALGATVIDTDTIAHALTAPGGAAIEPIREAFGADVLTANGALDRIAMRHRVFADPRERTRLEAILHPLIRAEAERQLCRPASADFAYFILVVPLLAETGAYRDRLDRILVIDCPEQTQIARVMTRNGLAHSEVEAIMAAQATRSERLAIADDVIENDADLDTLHMHVAVLHARYRAAAEKHAAPSETSD